MSFINPCLTTLALSSAAIAASLTVYGNVKSKQLYNILDENQRIAYNNFKNERLQLYVKGYVFGLIISMYYAFVLDRRNKPIDYCIFSLIVQVITIVIYKFYPKEYYLEDYLTTDEQKRQFAILSQEISYSYVAGMGIGILLFLCTQPRC